MWPGAPATLPGGQLRYEGSTVVLLQLPDA